MKKRKQYDDEFRASAVVMLKAAGYPERDGAVTAVSKVIGVPRTTIRRWFRGTNNPPPEKLLRDKTAKIQQKLDTEIYTLLNVMPVAWEQSSCRELSIALGILIDKRCSIENSVAESPQLRLVKSGGAR